MAAKKMHHPNNKSGKVTKRALQAIETRNRIYEAATRLMRQNGFDNMTIEQISDAAAVSVGAFYHYFESKNDILNEIFKRADNHFSEKVVGQLAGDTTAEKIVAFFIQYARFNMDLGVDHVSALYKTQSRFFISKNRPMFTALRDIIAGALGKNELNSTMGPEEITELLFATARGLTYSWCLHHGGFALEEKMERYMALNVHALFTYSGNK
jgi:AcrR family transcriptional regulator